MAGAEGGKRAGGGRVCVVGSCNYDQTAYMPQGEKIPRGGMTVFGSLYAEGFGGKGANQAVMAALLGTPTSMVGAVGQDSIGERTRRNFESLGIDTSHLASKADVASGVAQITVGGDGQNVIIVVPGANLQLTEQEVEAARNEIQTSKVVLLQNEILPSVSCAAMRVAREAPQGTGRPLIVLNAAPAPKVGPHAERGEWADISNHLRLCDVLCVNESEAQTLSGVPVTGEGDELLKSAEAAGAALRQKGAESVLLTLGEAGCMLLEGDKPPHAVPVQGDGARVMDTSGAGDAFLGALAAFVAAGWSIRDAMRPACEIATATVALKGTQHSFRGVARSLPSALIPSARDMPPDGGANP